MAFLKKKSMAATGRAAGKYSRAPEPAHRHEQVLLTEAEADLQEIKLCRIIDVGTVQITFELAEQHHCDCDRLKEACLQFLNR